MTGGGLELSAHLLDQFSLPLVVQALERFPECQPVNGQDFFRTLKLRLADGPHIPEAHHLGDFPGVITFPTRMALDFDMVARLFQDLPDRALQP